MAWCACSEQTGSMAKELDLGWAIPQLGALQRREDSGFGTGLSRAIADRLSVDVTLVRVAFIVLGLSAGFGVALYLWGTALTHGPNGTRPVDTVAPGFATWPRRAQVGVVIGTTILLVVMADSVAPLPWPVGVLILGALIFVARGRSKQSEGHTRSASLNAPGVTHSDEALIAEWRRVMTAAAGPAAPSHLPVVDLYSPAPEPEPLPIDRPRPAWFVGLGIAAATLAAGVVPAALGVDLLVSAGTALLTAGLLSVLFAAVVRRRRLPRSLVFLLALSLVPAGWMATQASPQSGRQAVPASVLAERIVARDATVEFTAADLEGIDEVRITAIASDVTIRLPGAPLSMSSIERGASITTEIDGATPALDINVVIEATMSEVTVVAP